MQESISLCRACLNVGVKMYELNNDLLDIFITLFGYSNQNCALAQHLCYECAWLVCKYHKFRNMCLNAQRKVCDLMKNHHKVAEDNIVKLQQSVIKSHKLELFFISQENSPIITEWDSIELKEEHVLSPEEVLIPSDHCDLRVDGDNLRNKELSLCEDNYSENCINESIKSKRKGVCDNSKNSKHKIAKKGLKSFLVKKTKNNQSNEDGLTHKEIAMQSDFIITNLTMEQQLAEITSRKLSSNYVDSPYKCDICYKGFLQAKTLRNHVVKHDPASGGVECGVCKVRFKTRRQCRLHTTWHAKHYACRRCAYTTVKIDQAQKHKQWHDGVTYKCTYCDEVSSKLTSHLSHIRIKHPSEYICHICGYSFVSDRGLKMHKSRMHKADGEDKSEVGSKEKSTDRSEVQLYCKLCDVKFASREAWKRHSVNSARHAGEANLDVCCRECGVQFPSRAALRAHGGSHVADRRVRTDLARKRYRGKRETKHEDTPKYPRRCEHCPEEIPSRSKHWKHYQRCHQDREYPLAQRNYICEICGKGFQGNAFLVYHKRTHFEERNYKCGQCPKAFFNRANLHIHAQTHSNGRPHRCSHCLKTFKTKLALHRHIKCHGTIGKSFPCPQCEASFPRLRARALHISTAHPHHS